MHHNKILKKNQQNYRYHYRYRIIYLKLK